MTTIYLEFPVSFSFVTAFSRGFLDNLFLGCKEPVGHGYS